MSHEHEGRDEPRTQPGRGDEHDDPASPSDSEAPSTDEREGDRRVGGSECELSSPRDEVADAETVLEAEIVRPAETARLDAVLTQWSGELPHPDDALKYEGILPGTLERILSMNERRVGIIERDQQIAIQRENTVHEAVVAESDVKTTLAQADRESLARGQWMSWSIGIGAVAVAIIGLLLGYPATVTALVVPLAQIGGQLVKTVTRDRNGTSTTEPHGDE